MERPNHVTFIFTPGPLGGAEKVVATGIRALKEMNTQISLIVIQEERAPQHADHFLTLLKELKLIKKIITTKRSFDLNLHRKLKRELANLNPTHIHAHGFKAIFYSYLAKPMTAKLVATQHGRTSHTLKVRIYELLETFIMRRSDAVIAVSHEMKQMLIKDKISSHKLFVIENMLSLKTDTIRPISNHLAFVGRLSPEKGCDHLLRALTLLPSDSPITLHIVGDGPERTNLERFVIENDLRNKVIFHGFVSNVSKKISKCEALVLPSLREGQPLSVIEAACSGLPILASEVGGIPSLIKNGENGLLYPPSSPERIADTLLKFQANKKEFTFNAMKKRKEYVERFSPQTWAKRTTDVYATVVSQ